MALGINPARKLSKPHDSEVDFWAMLRVVVVSSSMIDRTSRNIGLKCAEYADREDLMALSQTMVRKTMRCSFKWGCICGCIGVEAYKIKRVIHGRYIFCL